MTELVKYEAACLAIAEALAVDEVLNIRDEWKAIEAASRIMKNLDLELRAMQIRFRAERRLGELVIKQRETIGLNRGGRPKKAEGETDSGAESVSVPTLREAGIAPKESMRAQKLARVTVEKFEALLTAHAEEVRSGKAKVATDLLKMNAEEEGRVHRRNLASALASASSLTPSGKKYPAGYGDPPWVRKAGIGNRAYENHYTTMSWPDILDYLKRVGEALQPDAWFWMWIPRAHLLAKVSYQIEVTLAGGEIVMATADLPLAYACELALGMHSYSTCYVWTKTDEEHPDQSGTGLLAWDQDELLLQFKRGRGLPKPASDEKFGSNHRERPREHSRKPDHYRDMIATMVGKDKDGQPLPVLELFARVDAEHPLPQNWDAWGNQAGVNTAPETSAAGEPSSAPSSQPDADLGARVIDDGSPAADIPASSGPLYDYPAIANRHVVSMTRDYPDSVSFSVATCQCGWTFRLETSEENCRRIDDAVDAHWLGVIAVAPEGAIGNDLPEPSGETEAAAAEATDGASVAAAVADFGASGSSPAPYDAGDVITIDQPAGSEWLAQAPFDPTSLCEREALTILSDFCHQRRDIAPDLGEFYRARGYSYLGVKEWSLTGKGWDRLRELQAETTPPGPRAELTEPFRAPQMSLFDAARQLEDAPPAELPEAVR
ncbi:N6-adenosine-specific RNA methylase IME4 [Bradyrhizobium japonicum]